MRLYTFIDPFAATQNDFGISLCSLQVILALREAKQSGQQDDYGAETCRALFESAAIEVVGTCAALQHPIDLLRPGFDQEIKPLIEVGLQIEQPQEKSARSLRFGDVPGG